MYQEHWQVVGVNRESSSQRRVLRTVTKISRLFATSNCLVIIWRKVAFVKRKKIYIFKYLGAGLCTINLKLGKV